MRVTAASSYLASLTIMAIAGPSAAESVEPLAPSPLTATAGMRRGASLRENPTEALRRFEEEALPEPPPRRAGVVVSRQPTAATRTPHRAGRAALTPLGTHVQAARSLSTDARAGSEPNAWLRGLELPDLPIRWDEKVLQYLDFYRRHPKGRAIFTAWLQRMGRYEGLIRARLRHYQLPEDLIYLAMIESSFDPLQTSPVGAAGIWQFMMSTAQGYGLRRDHWIDERRNPELSTDAALKLLKHLHERLGSWPLAFAAYNAGFGAVVEAMRKYNTNDYWRLCRYEAGLPWATVLYVPKILAAAIVGRNRAAFGFAEVRPDPPLEHELAVVPLSVTIEQLAEAVGVDPGFMAELNPELRRGRTPPGARVWVRVPKSTAARLHENLEPLRRARYRPHVVRLGETDESIAESYGIDLRELRRINHLRSSSEIRPGLTVFVPSAAAAAIRRHAGAHADETFVIALPAGAPDAVPGRPVRVFYRVVLGDTLSRIARHLHTTAERLAEWNGILPDARLVSGMVLQSFVAADFPRENVALLDPARVQVLTTGSKTFLDLYEQRKGRRRLVYRVRRGDNLARIARRFGLSLGSLMRINGIDRSKELKPGDSLIVYVARGPTGQSDKSATARARRADERTTRVRPQS